MGETEREGNDYENGSEREESLVVSSYNKRPLLNLVALIFFPLLSLAPLEKVELPFSFLVGSNSSL